MKSSGFDSGSSPSDESAKLCLIGKSSCRSARWPTRSDLPTLEHLSKQFGGEYYLCIFSARICSTHLCLLSYIVACTQCENGSFQSLIYRGQTRQTDAILLVIMSFRAAVSEKSKCFCQALESLES